MHEFQQYSQITHGRFQQVCHILAGVSGSRPIKIHEQHLVYQQLKVNDHNPVKKGAPKPASGPALRSNYERLVRDLSGSESDGAASAWRLLHEELPEAGVKSVISRAYSDNPIDDATLQKFRPGSEWYRYVKQFIVSGTRFVSGNVIVKISQIMLPFQASTETPLDAPLPSNEDLRPLDPSGAYLVESCVRIDDATNSKLRERAIEELTAFTKSLEGAVDLRVPDRLALDTRVKAS